MSANPYSPPEARVGESVTAANPSVRPSQVKLALWLAAISYLSGLVGIAVEWDYFGKFQSPAMFALSQSFSILVGGWLYYKIYQGRNWARVVLLVFWVLGALLYLSGPMRSLVAAMPLLAKIRVGIGMLVSGIILWLLFVSPGKWWFRRG